MLGPSELEGWLDRWRQRAPVTVFATDEEGEVDVAELADLPTNVDADDLDEGSSARRPSLLLLGSERSGLARGLRDLADVTVRIPMSGTASSLNVAVAHGIVLHALTR